MVQTLSRDRTLSQLLSKTFGSTAKVLAECKLMYYRMSRVCQSCCPFNQTQDLKLILQGILGQGHCKDECIDVSGCMVVTAVICWAL